MGWAEESTPKGIFLPFFWLFTVYVFPMTRFEGAGFKDFQNFRPTPMTHLWIFLSKYFPSSLWTLTGSHLEKLKLLQVPFPKVKAHQYDKLLHTLGT
jgi:hypothetical protein